MKNFWYILANALGSKANEDDKVADLVAVVRFIIVMLYMVTNFFIIAGVIRHW